MAGRGPAPKDPAERRRRNKTSTKMQLPAEGRAGVPPAFPGEVSDRVGELWVELWSLPQAVAWERLGYLREVALYCRHMVAAEDGDLKAAGEARMRSDRLGLTPAALRSLQWEIVEDEVGEAREARPVPERKLRAVDPAAS